MGQELSLPLAGTNDCHYLNREDAETHDILLCIQTGKTINDPKRLKFSTDQFFFKSRERNGGVARGFPEALDNTGEIARLCQYEMEFGRYKYPVFCSSDSNLEIIWMRCLPKRPGRVLREDWKPFREEGTASAGRGGGDTQTVWNLNSKIIHKMGFAGYFLIVADFIDYARAPESLWAPGAGSAAGSLVAYCLNITNVDPLKYGLLFERFLNPGRISMPDIDIDFCINGRDDVIRYVSEKYGRENVGQIITFGTMKARAAIRDVGRVLGVPYGDVDRIAKLIPAGPNVSLDAGDSGRTGIEKNGPGRGSSEGKLLTIARSLEGSTRHASTHASGWSSPTGPLSNTFPFQRIQ